MSCQSNGLSPHRSPCTFSVQKNMLHKTPPNRPRARNQCLQGSMACPASLQVALLTIPQTISNGPTDTCQQGQGKALRMLIFESYCVGRSAKTPKLDVKRQALAGMCSTCEVRSQAQSKTTLQVCHIWQASLSLNNLGWQLPLRTQHLHVSREDRSPKMLSTKLVRHSFSQLVVLDSPAGCRFPQRLDKFV